MSSLGKVEGGSQVAVSFFWEVPWIGASATLTAVGTWRQRGSIFSSSSWGSAASLLQAVGVKDPIGSRRGDGWGDTQGGGTLPDLKYKVFVFPEESNDSLVLVQARPEHPLLNFTVCLRSYTDLTRPYSLFSYATKEQDNEIVLLKFKPTEYRFYVGGKYVAFRVPESHMESEHVCVTWESPTGIVRFWLNKNPWPRKGLQKGYEVGNEAVVVLGQEQDAFGGGFDAQQSFVGEISDVYMWDVGLSNSEVKMLDYSEPYANPIFGWRNFPYKIEGEVYLVS